LTQSGKWEEAKSEYLKIITDKSVDLQVKIKIGSMFISQASVDSTALGNAKDIFTAIEKDTSDWQVNLYLGEICLQEKNDSCAIDYFRIVTEQASWNVEPWIRLGGILFDNHNYAEAAQEMEKAVKSFPDEYVINVILGLSYAQEGVHDLAEVYLAKAVKLNPNDFNSLFAYGFTLNRLDKKDEAIKYLKMALRINSESPEVHSLLGSIYSEKKMYKECDESYEKALAIDSTDILTLNNYAYSLSERGEKLDYALEMVKKSVESDPENSSYLDTIGWVYFKLGDYEKAYNFIEKAIKVEDTNSVLVEHLGDVLFKKGEKERAIETWKKALELDKNNKELIDKIEKEEL
jgi:tetratricopeptide (TPR) repeat protein